MLVEFIQEEAKVNEKINLVEKPSQFKKSSLYEKSMGSSPIFDEHKQSYNIKTDLEKDSRECVLCGKTDHVVTIGHFGRQVVQYFSCKMFTDMTPREIQIIV